MSEPHDLVALLGAVDALLALPKNERQLHDDLRAWARRHIDQALEAKQAQEDYEACQTLQWYQRWLNDQ